MVTAIQFRLLCDRMSVLQGWDTIAAQPQVPRSVQNLIVQTSRCHHLSVIPSFQNLCLPLPSFVVPFFPASPTPYPYASTIYIIPA